MTWCTRLQSLEHPQWVYIWVGCLSAAAQSCSFSEVQQHCLDRSWLWRKGTVAGPWLQTELQRPFRQDRSAAPYSLGSACWHKAEQPCAKMFYLPPELQFTCAAFLCSLTDVQVAPAVARWGLNTLISVSPHSTFEDCFLQQGKNSKIDIPFVTSTLLHNFPAIIPSDKKSGILQLSSVFSLKMWFYFLSQFSPVKWHFLGDWRHFSNINLDLWLQL